MYYFHFEIYKNFSNKFEYDEAKQMIHQIIYTTLKEE